MKDLLFYNKYRCFTFCALNVSPVMSGSATVDAAAGLAYDMHPPGNSRLVALASRNGKISPTPKCQRKVNSGKRPHKLFWNAAVWWSDSQKSPTSPT